MRLDPSAIDLGPVSCVAAGDARLYLTRYISNGAPALQVVSRTKGLLGTLSRNIAGVSDALPSVHNIVIDPMSPWINAAAASGAVAPTGRSISADGALLPVWRVGRPALAA